MTNEPTALDRLLSLIESESASAMPVLRSDRARMYKNARSELAELRAAVADVESVLDGEGACDSCLLWSHIAQMLRQRGFATGAVFDEHFEGTSLAAIRAQTTPHEKRGT